VVHLPIAHHNTIERGNKTLVNVPITKEESHWPADHLISLWVYNELDNGQKPKKTSELPEPERRPFLQFRFGNLWQNWIANGLCVVIAFAPIDDENTLMYVCYYHTVRFPVLCQLTGWIGNLANLVIERMDRRVVITQRPSRRDLGIGEILIQGDSQIVLHRKIRRSLIERKG
jgi:phenylpropionate dioxygenase-like ring-hydroxylating dioxygenase large terminal subunit